MSPVNPSPRQGTVVGVDLGGTKTAAALVGRDGELGPVHTGPTPARSGPEAVLDTVGRIVRSVITDGEADGVPVRAIGIGTAGVVDVARATIISSTDAFTDWVGTDVRDGVHRRIAPLLGTLPVSVENDVDAHAGGEAWLGAAAGVPTAFMAAVGTGVGGAVILDGRPLRGAHHVAGELGHVPTPGAEGLRCSCGRPGHLEAIAAGPALHRRYLALGGAPDSPDARDVVARAVEGDELAARVVRDGAAAVGRGLAGVVTVLDPSVVVVGGGVAEAGPQWWDEMERAFRSELIDALSDVPVRPATLGASAAIIGAARSAWQLVDSAETAPVTAVPVTP